MNWNLIDLQEDIQPRYNAFVTHFNDNQIIILGGVNSNLREFGEVLLFDFWSNNFETVVTAS